MFLILFVCCFFGSKAMAWECWVDYRGGWATPVYQTYDGYYYTNYYSPCYRPWNRPVYYYSRPYYYSPAYYGRYYRPYYNYYYGW